MAEWTINEEQARMILETEPRKIEETNALNHIHLSKEERVKHAAEILRKWKENQGGNS